MSESAPLDPYYLWLGIPPEEQPPDHYRLLGVRRFETNPDVINSAAQRQISHVRSFAIGPHSEASQKLLNELARAKIDLVTPERRAKYDAQLRAKLNQRGEVSPAPARRNIRENVKPSPKSPAQPQAAQPAPAVPVSAEAVKPVRVTATPVQATPVAAPTSIKVDSAPGKESPLRSWTKNPLAIASVGGGAAFLLVALLIVMNIGGEPDPSEVPSPAVPPSTPIAQLDPPATVTPAPPTPETPNSPTTQLPVPRGSQPAATPDEPTNEAPVDNSADNSANSAAASMYPVLEFDDSAPSRFDVTVNRTATEAQISQFEWASFLGCQENEPNSVTMQMVLIPPGMFTMGSPPSDPDSRSDEAAVSVVLTNPFFISRTEITRGEWQAVMGTAPWSGERHHTESERLPATHVSWEDAQAFCKKLTALEQAAGKLATGTRYRLLTEAEWEFAARGGSTNRYYFGNDTDGLATEAMLHRTALSRCNPFSLADVHGNAREWCADRYQPQLPGGQNPFVATGTEYVCRGGSWDDEPAACRSAARSHFPATSKQPALSFRVARTIVWPPNSTPVNPSAVAGNPADPTPEPLPNAPGTLPPQLIPQGPVPEIFVATVPRTAADARAAQQQWASYFGANIEETNSLGMRLAMIPPGKFLMGAHRLDTQAEDDERPQVEVTLTFPLFIGCTEVTRGEWKKLMPPNSRWNDTPEDNLPASNLTWGESQRFLQKLNEHERNLGRLPKNWTYRLPSEAEWEYAARAGVVSPYLSGYSTDGLEEYGHYETKWNQPFSAVAQLRPNQFGMFDVHGGVVEWCQDVYQPRLPGGLNPCFQNASLEPRDRLRVLHGSNTYTPPSRSHLSSRRGGTETVSGSDFGLRVALAYDLDLAPTLDLANISIPPAPTPPLLDIREARSPAEVQEAQSRWAAQLKREVVYKNDLGIELALIPPGRFWMGTPQHDGVAERSEVPQQEVALTKPFYVSRTEITQAQWQAVMQTTPWPSQAENPQAPVTHITKVEAINFCDQLNQRDPQLRYRLCTDAEWEFAARAGTTTRYSFGDDESQLGEYAWWKENNQGERHPLAVAQKLPNAFGLFDMYGNVAEYCLDVHLPNRHPAGINPILQGKGAGQVHRGGSFLSYASECRSASRGSIQPAKNMTNYGFRIAGAIVAEKAAIAEAWVPDTPYVAKPVPIKLDFDVTRVSLPRGRPPVLDATGPRTSDDVQSAQRQWARHLQREVVETNSVGIDLVLIPPGTFYRGSFTGTPNVRPNETPASLTLLTNPFDVSRTEVTREQWLTVMKEPLEYHPQDYFDHPNLPMALLNWFQCQEFCRRLNDLERQQGTLPDDLEYRLLTEAEWEYACRAGTTTRYFTGDDPASVHDYAWANIPQGEGIDQLFPVGTKKPNAFGLFDMLGNVEEFCLDGESSSPLGGVNPFYDLRVAERVNRGGHSGIWSVGSAETRAIQPEGRTAHLGFRIARAARGEIGHSAQGSPFSLKPSDDLRPFSLAPPLFDATTPRTPDEVIAAQDAWARHLGTKALETNSHGMQLVLVPAGRYVMGSPDKADQEERQSAPPSEVTLTQPFYIGKTEVTQAQWFAVMRTRPWQVDNLPDGDNIAACRVWGRDALEFCRQLTTDEIDRGTLTPGWEYALPTEAQWEFACRAGTCSRFYFGDSEDQLPEYAWVQGNSEQHPHAVAQKLPNALGLFDMHGNVAEYCIDRFTLGLFGGANPITSHFLRAAALSRGGGFQSTPQSICASASREHPSFKYDGLRVVLVRIPD